MTKKYIMHVLSGTHWDREWRYTAEQSKLRLADLIDSLITLMENNPEYSYFHLDGGIIVLEDYLSVHPEMEQRLARLIQKGRILLVPWYTLPDMFIVMPECIIRNLLMGRRIIEPHGKAMKSGYTATSYGQNCLRFTRASALLISSFIGVQISMLSLLAFCGRPLMAHVFVCFVALMW